MTFLNKTLAPINIVGDLHQINFSLDDFKRIIEDNFLYVDKTKMIEDILTYDKGKAILITRPRRFGKSLNLSMLRYFFDMTDDSRSLFKNLYIEKSEVFEKHINQYPVFYLNFKDVTINNIKDINETIADVIEKQIEILYNKYQFQELKELHIYSKSGTIKINKIKEITEILCKKTGKKVFVLIDEYDSLLNRTYGTAEWKITARIIKKIFGSLLKSNEYLEMGVLTGVSRIGKELGFSDLNNLSVCSLTKERYYPYFGFTEAEVRELLFRNKIEMTNDFYRMYNGYHIGKTPNMFNTVSILKFLDDFYDTGDVVLSPYWINSSANTILKDNIRKMNIRFRNKLIKLLDGSTIAEGIFENIEYDLLDNPAHMINLLIDTGYLCPIKKIGGNLFEIKIPNEEVLYGYQSMADSIIGADSEVLDSLCNCLIEENIEKFESELNNILLKVSSFNDFGEKENSYHCLLEGALLYMLGKFKVLSNREASIGRFDIALIPTNYFRRTFRPIIIEFKVAKESRKDKKYSEYELLQLAENALCQIETRSYFSEYEHEYERKDFLLIGIGAQGKRCRVFSR